MNGSPLACPHCGVILEEGSARKRKCPDCGGPLYRRTLPSSRQKVLVTKEQAKRIDLEWHKAYLKGKWSNVLKGYENVLMDDRASLAAAHYQEALLLWEEGKDFFPLLHEGRRWALMKYKQEGAITQVQISTAREEACLACQALEGKTFTVDQALREMPLPNKNCTNGPTKSTQGFCRCGYVAYNADWDISIQGEQLPGGDIGIIRRK